MAYLGYKWGAPQFGTSGGVVTWAIAQYPGALFSFSNAIAPGPMTATIANAFEAWETVADINFVQVADTGQGSADIRIAWSYIDGPSGVLGKASSSYSFDGTINFAEIILDEQETYDFNPSDQRYDGVNAYALAVHEIGHAIGLDHVDDPSALMYPLIDPAFTGLTAPDINAVTAIYGPAPAPPMDVLAYIASYADLIQSFGINAQAGLQHWRASGRAEGRETTFDGLEYIASYSDLAATYGTNSVEGTKHFILAGFAEGRTTSFEPLDYIASYADLAAAYGTNGVEATKHFIQRGIAEGRQTSFEPLDYIASYGDLIGAFGTNEDAGVLHYIATGRAEGRSPDDFDELQYLSNYADLRAAFGDDQDAAVRHYIETGYQEGRTDDADQFMFF